MWAITKGPVKQKLDRAFDEVTVEGQQRFKPDIDIVIITVPDEKPIAILSAKTSLAERVMQTISWHNFMRTAPAEFQDIKLFLVTAWETFESETTRTRVQQLDGVYVCNTNVREYGNIAVFSKILDDLKVLIR